MIRRESIRRCPITLLVLGFVVTARLITSGDLALAAVSTTGTLARAALAALLVLAGAWTLRRRAHVRTAGHA